MAPSAAANVLGPRAAHSPNADDIHTTYWVMLIVATLLLVAIHVALIGALVRFRARRGRHPRRVVAGPRSIGLAAAPLAAVAVAIFVFGAVMSAQVEDVQPSEASAQSIAGSSGLVAQAGSLSIPSDAQPLRIRVVGQQWLWRFDYPLGDPGPPYDVYSFNQLVVPVDTTVILDVTSTDVVHRWFAPALGGQVDAVPGQTNETWFRADEVGVYPAESTSYSGTGYPAMRAWVQVVSPERYQQFVSTQKREIAASQDFVIKSLKQPTAPGEETP